MSKYSIIALLAAIVLPICMLSCSEETEDDNEFANWQQRNDDFFNDIYVTALNSKDGTWKIIRNYTYNDSVNIDVTDNIVVKVLKEGTGSGSPIYTDSVLLDYRGRLIPTRSYKDGYVFEQSYSGEYDPATAKPVKFMAGQTVDGFATALQHMHIGDRWLVYVPYKIGYGSVSNGSVPAYSTMIFDLALRAYYRSGRSAAPMLEVKTGWITE